MHLSSIQWRQLVPPFFDWRPCQICGRLRASPPCGLCSPCDQVYHAHQATYPGLLATLDARYPESVIWFLGHSGAFLDPWLAEPRVPEPWRARCPGGGVALVKAPQDLSTQLVSLNQPAHVIGAVVVEVPGAPAPLARVAGFVAASLVAHLLTADTLGEVADG